MIVYVCSPFRAPTAALVARNIYRAARWAERLRERGYVPLVPHTMTAGHVPGFGAGAEGPAEG